MAQGAAELSDKDFLNAYVAEYLDGELPEAQRKRMEALLTANAGTVGRFQAARGKLQLAMQEHFVGEAEIKRLHGFAQDDQARATEEAQRMSQVGRRELLGDLRRRIVISTLVVAVIFAIVYLLTPAKAKAFHPLDYLGYEALAMEDDPEGRLDLPTDDIEEIRHYFAAYPGLAFKPKALRPLGRGWEPEGATVIDYEIAKVAVVQYGNKSNDEKLFHFVYPGQMADLPKAELGNLQGFIYRTYASDQLNLVVWESGDGLINFLVGHRSAPELAELAKEGSN